MRTSQVIRAFLGLSVVVGLAFIIVINFTRSFPKQKGKFLKETFSILEKGLETADDIRENEAEKKNIKEAETLKTRAAAGRVSGSGKLGVADTRGKLGVADTRGKLGVADTSGKESGVDARVKESLVETHDKVGVDNARDKQGAADTRDKGIVVNARAKEGVAGTRGGVNITDTRSESSLGFKDANNSAIKENVKPKRLSLIMIGHDRSGTTFINRMFNEDPNVFNVYEPLWITKSIGPPEKHPDVIMDALNGMLNCNFSATKIGIKFLAEISKWIAVRLNCKAMMSHPFCKIKNGQRVCENMPPRLTDEVCAKRYKYSVTKLAVTRIPNENISIILERLLDENPYTRVLYMIRDPRGTINSRINAGWTKEYPDPELEGTVKSVCDTTAYNFRYMQLLMKKSEYRHRCMVVRYKDISANPLAVAKKIYNFARFQIEPRLTDWVMNHTRPSKEKLTIESYNRYSVVRNATGNADKWRREAPVERVGIINRVCAPLLRLLGVSE